MDVQTFELLQAGFALVKRKVYRIGVETLWRHPDGRWAVTLRNRTYSRRFDIPPEKVEAWQREFAR